MMIFDSHCHLNLFDSNQVSTVIQEAQKDGVKILITICTKLEEVPQLALYTSLYKGVYMSIGVHPNNAQDKVTVEELVNYIGNNAKTVAIGETGLDYHYKITEPIVQEKDFRVHIEAARRTNLPVVIHSRNADQDMIRVLKDEMTNGKFKAIMHSFSSSYVLCEEALALGCYISFSGILTFNNAANVREIAKIVPVDRLLIETDAPYLAPVPHRGKQNEPKYVVHTLECLEETRNEDALAETLLGNFYSVFSRISKD